MMYGAASTNGGTMPDDDDVERSGAAAQQAVRHQLVRLRRVVERGGLGARVGVVMLGVVLVVVGSVLLVIPGPGWPLVITGIAALAVVDRRLRRPVLSLAGFVGRMTGRVRRSALRAAAIAVVGMATASTFAYVLLWR